MFFTLSKALFYLIKPLFLVVIFLTLSFLIKDLSWKKYFRITGFCLLLFFSNPFISSIIYYKWEFRPVLIQDLKQYGFGIVLTGITDPVMLPRDRVYINYGADRVLHALQLYRLGKIKKILITGNNGLYPDRKLTEAEELKNVFLLAKIPEADIVLENDAINTHQNAVFSKKVLGENGAQGKSLLITSAFHMRRASACFAKAGVAHDVFPVSFYGNEPDYSITSLFLPSENAIGLWVMTIHEVVGYLTYKIMGYC